MRNTLKLIAAVALCEAAGVAGAFFTTPAVRSGWYAALAKPSLAPPSWVFGPVWITLYALMGVALFLIWKDRAAAPAARRHALLLFFIQLFLNALWSPIFFGSTSLTINGINNIGLALADIVLLWAGIVLTIFLFRKISRLAAWLLAPYLLWVSFAVYLNATFWLLN